MGIFAEVEKVIRSQRFKKNFFDLLGSSRWLPDSSDIDEIVKNGWYAYAETNTSKNKPFTIGEIFVIGSPVESSCQQIAFNRSTFSTTDTQMKIRRLTTNSGWSAWEWINPPMELNVGYRTIKRRETFPVYVKRIDFGELPNTTTKSIELGVSAVQIISIHGYMITENDNHYPIPYVNTSGATVVWYRTSGSKLMVQTAADMSGKNAWFVIEYTQTE